MTVTHVGYGWTSASAPECCAYIAPLVLRIVQQLDARGVCGLGSGNGALAAAARDAGLYVVGVEPDEEGVARSREWHPGINFYNLGVEDDAA